MPFPHRILKMKSLLKIFALWAFIPSPCFAQDDKPETVFVSTPYNGKPSMQLPWFGQLSVTIPVRATPERSSTNDTNSVFDYVLPDGLSANYGVGLHFNSWAGISGNAGIDWIGSEKLVVAPVYGSVMLNPTIYKEYSLLMQFGYGYSFALGRGDLNGTFQKYRIGLGVEDYLSLYVELNQYGFPLHDMDPAGSIGIGLCVFDFL